MFSYYTEPKIIRNFLTEKECDFLLNCKGDLCDYETSQFNERIKNNTVEYINSHRKVISKELALPIIKICSDKMDIPISKIRAVNVIKYEKGGFIPIHSDAGDSTPRPYTFLLYLNDDYTGGETHFPFLNKTFRLNKGDALFFHNRDSDGFYTNLALHEGKTVTSGQKFVANVWVYD